MCHDVSGFQGDVASVSLEGFCDVSVNAYAAVVYLRIETPEETHLKFLTSKTRVAPLVKQPIPRLELLSALILARLIARVKTVLEGLILISYVRCWTDSKVALYWIRGEDREWKQFFKIECARSGVLYHQLHGVTARVKTTQLTLHLAENHQQP